MKPLKEKDLWCCKACGSGICDSKDVLSALALAKKKIDKLADNIEKMPQRPTYLTIKEIDSVIATHIRVTKVFLDECFQIKKEEKNDR